MVGLNKLRVVLAAMFGALLVVTVAGLSLLFGSASVQAEAATSSLAQPEDDTCGVLWSAEAPPASSPDLDTHLYTVDSISATDIWAVGDKYDPSDGTRAGYVVTYDGTSWNEVPIPSIPGAFSVRLTSVAAITSDTVWVSGYACDQNTCNTLILRWNGHDFQIIPSPNVPSVRNLLNDIAAFDTLDIWAAGYTSEGNFAYKPLVMHWDGVAWTIVETPDLGEERAVFSTVAASGPNDVWAIGNYNDESGDVTGSLSMHWNGTTWTDEPMPVPEGTVGEVTLNGSIAHGPNDAWAVGHVRNHALQSVETLTYHWDGSVWNIVPSPSIGGFDNTSYLLDISAWSPDIMWAVGYGTRSGSPELLFLEWFNNTWTMKTLPAPNSTGLGGVTVVTPTDVWAVGYERYRGNGELYDRPVTYHLAPRCYSATPTMSVEPTATNTAVPPRCPGELFTDVCPSDYFYEPVLELNELEILTGYNTSPPCLNGLHVPCFKPYDSSTRGQIAKIVSLAASFTEPVTGQTFEDVPVGSTFYEYIERMAAREIIVGYPCGEPGEPCLGGDRPYFRPGETVTRGQLAKMVARAFQFTEPVAVQTFEDVPVGSTFFEDIGRIHARGIINGYPCDFANPCNDPPLPYFRPGYPVTRGQTAKIVYLSMTQPLPTATVTVVSTSTATTLPTFTPVETTTPTAEVTETTVPTSTTTPEATLTATSTTTAEATITPISTSTAEATVTVPSKR